LYSAASVPMLDIFDLQKETWSFPSVVPDILRNSTLPLPAPTAENSMPRTAQVLAYSKDQHDSFYWQKRLGGMDYQVEDKLDTPRFNRELWKGMMGGLPYPTTRSGLDLRTNRSQLLHLTTRQ